ncbi:phospholipase D family protein [Ancylomarina sp. DW003]|nr:phospholipase D family protein [Ancylomarina sp. DW003]MDE5421533.1 phospholipase D family protein [Ancylomarina sp. DW003]
MEFLTGKELENDIYDTIFYTEKYLLVLSPFIQLDEYFKNEVFKTHLNNAQVHVIIGFGKNEQNISRSFKKQDIEYFTQFPNITIVYIPNLHAKYYGNEKKAIVTSMNLIDYSFINNIEFGVSAVKKTVGTNRFFVDSQNKCFKIVEEEGYTIFVKRPKFKKRLLGLGKDYVGSDVELDIIEDIASGKEIGKIRLSDFRDEQYVNSALKGDRVSRESSTEEIPRNKKTLKSEIDLEQGHCIRCNKKIKLDIDKPLCWECFKVWDQYGDKFHPEKFCISCGKEKDVYFSKPACYKCFSELKSFAETASKLN